MKKKIFFAIMAVLIFTGGLLSAQTYKKEIRVKKTIRGNDTVISSDTIVIKDGIPDSINPELFRKKIKAEVEKALRPLRDSDITGNAWKQSMLHLDSINDLLDFDMDMSLRPPAYMFYFNNGKDSIIWNWDYVDADEFERELSRIIEEMNQWTDMHFSGRYHLRNSNGNLSDKFKISEWKPGLYDLQIINPLTIRYVKVYSATGRLVYYKYMSEQPADKTIIIDLRNESPGDYFLEVISDQGRFIKLLTL